jgi:hypothetical protein
MEVDPALPPRVPVPLRRLRRPPNAAIAGSTALLAAGRPAGWWLAAAGALVKLSPAAAWAWGRTAWRTAIAVLVLTTVALVGTTALARHPDDGWLGYSLHRGVQVESLAASTAWIRQELAGSGSRFAYRFKSFEIDGADPDAVFWVLVGLGGLAALAARAGRGGGLDPCLAAFTALVLLLMANKVLSPQFVALPAPLAAVLGGRWFRGLAGHRRPHLGGLRR